MYTKLHQQVVLNGYSLSTLHNYGRCIAKPLFVGPKQVLKYIGRYSHKVAISNHRLVAMSQNKVTFRYKDYLHGGVQKLMTLDKHEFLRRFALHILLKGLVHIRH